MMAMSAKPGSMDLGKDSEPQLPALSQVIDIPVNMEDIAVSTGFTVDSRKTRHSPDAKGTFALALKELDRVEIQLSADDNMPEKGKTYSGYLVVLNTLRTLPVGSTFDAEKGMFYWQPGPAFLGDYEFVFLKEKDKEKTRKSLKIRVGKVPKIEKSILPIIDSITEGDRDNPQAMPTGAVNAVEVPEMEGGDGTEPSLNSSESSSRIESVGQKAITVTKSGEKVFFTTGALVPTYYFYSYDGKLLAEYDQSGNCVRDYIYAAGRLVAEYKPQENKYYYYTSDQISSVRMITDDAGTVAYSAAYSPFGKTQKIWTNAYDPKMKFSGKERENGPQVDYFGARYYANLYYRFLSVDPVINKDEAINDPQRWNLYAYCRNNPITFMDPDGNTVVNINIRRTRFSATATLGELSIPGSGISGYTLEPPWKDNVEFKSCIKCDTYKAFVEKWSKKPEIDILRLEDKNDRTDVEMHPGKETKNTAGCIIPGSGQDAANETVSGSKDKLKEITDYIKRVQVIDFFKKEKTEIMVSVSISTERVNSIISAINTIIW